MLLESKSKILGMLPEAVDPEPDVEVELEPGDRVSLSQRLAFRSSAVAVSWQ